MRFPDFLEPVRKQGYELYARHAIGEIAFSGPTYQIEIFDEKSAPIWVFVQLEGQSIKDVFCSCDTSSEQGLCPHMAAGCYAVYGGKHLALHERFERSFWHTLFFSMSQKCKTAAVQVTKTRRGYEVKTAEGELLFSASEQFGLFLDKRTQETEETSIKFSNLTDDELEHWRSGQPSPFLRYELSLFSDVAKWLFLQSDAPRVSFHTLDRVEITAGDLKIDLSLTKQDLIALIPYLNTVSSNLTLFEPDIASMTWHADVGSMTVERALDVPKEVTPIGEWVFVENMGFWPKKGGLKKEEYSSSDALDELFSSNLDRIRSVLTGYSFEERPQTFSYRLFFDSAQVLHIEKFLQEPGDLALPSRVFGSWAYIKPKRFVAVESSIFSETSLEIAPEAIGDFITAHRTWLSQFPGFAVHMTRLEEEIVYEVDSQANLRFHCRLQKLTKTKKRIDLGEWIYVVGDGFYMKHFMENTAGLFFKEPVFRYAVADFIRRHQDVLYAVRGFFAADCPVKEVGIRVHLKSKGVIEILPEYSWHDPEDKKQAVFYDEFVFVPHKGFYRLPATLRPLHFARIVRQDDPQAWIAFFSEQLPRLEKEYTCYVDPRLMQPENLALTLMPESGAGNALRDWDLDIYWQSKRAKVSLDTLLDAKNEKVRYVPTEAGLVDLEQDRFHWLDDIAKKRVKKRGPFRLESYDFLRIASYDTITVGTSEESVKAGFKQVLEGLLTLKPPESPEFSRLNCELRSYQVHGVEWLWYLYSYRLSGLLCDDMGVGKTHQAMGLMDAIRTAGAKKGKKSLFLVICPTSLVYHWQDKIEQFLPGFMVKAYVGSDRTLADFPGDFDVLLTSYGIWRNEYAKMKQYRFDAAFFDELQIAKNHVSQIHAALLQVQSDMKLGLTGTPIENQLRELKAVFDLVLPGYMPKDSDFREFFVRPIERQENSERKKLLSRYVRPFVLRRRKVDVLPDLPEKSEEVCRTELVGEQKSLYRHVASHQALPLLQQLKDEANPIPYMHIFQLISSLKQICNHPATYLKDVENYERYESGKWEAFVELVEEAMESEQKVVVFSQYLGMLDIIEAHLKKQAIGYAQIRGQTKQRGKEVQSFHEDPGCKIFLGSLQAAGLGIDLTPASVVIHYDRWWNAARENQATDRVHRIGQVRGVQVFKMMTKGSIEESIDLMIQKKERLLEDVVFFDDHQIVKKLTRQEIIGLLEGLSH